jgi:hypothetical protein
MVRTKILSGLASPYPFGCDHCGTRLYDPEPGKNLLSYPTRHRATCPGCGWSGDV